ncbi:MAG: helix-turn-helix domain-containing protein [Pirellulales bacterium]|nr:helix-turn-helix domain-containing protein [Pirellulales bacterium]
MEVKDHLPLEELKRLERIEKDADRARRLRILILAVEGWTAPAVGMAVGLSRRICQRWVRRYNEEGLAGRRGGWETSRGDWAEGPEGGPASAPDIPKRYFPAGLVWRPQGEQARG